VKPSAVRCWVKFIVSVSSELLADLLPFLLARIYIEHMITELYIAVIIAYEYQTISTTEVREETD
jgi:hypothetical protein